MPKSHQSYSYSHSKVIFHQFRDVCICFAVDLSFFAHFFEPQNVSNQTLYVLIKTKGRAHSHSPCITLLQADCSTCSEVETAPLCCCKVSTEHRGDLSIYTGPRAMAINDHRYKKKTSGLSLTANVRSLVIQEELRAEPALLLERSLLIWFRHLTKMYSG